MIDSVVRGSEESVSVLRNAEMVVRGRELLKAREEEGSD
jgi:hypothetical protein